jgi:apolipoprotein N-acyltransferase
MQRKSLNVPAWKLWAAAGLSAGLLELPFPLAGPLPIWRTAFAWFGLVPLLWAILLPAATNQPRPLRRAFLLSYLCGFLWYTGNCYWVRDTMSHYGDMPAMAPTLLLGAFSLVLGLYFGLFGLCVALVRRTTGSTRLALAAAPILWTALELAASRITSVPWDQLGYSQVDNALVNQLAPWTGVYGISFLLVAVNVLITGGLVLSRSSGRRQWGIAGAVLLVGLGAGVTMKPPKPAATATAVLVQPNLDVAGDNRWSGPGEWEQHIAEFTRLAGEQCKTYIAGLILRIPIWWLGLSRPRRSMRQTQSSKRRSLALLTPCRLRWWWVTSAGTTMRRGSSGAITIRRSLWQRTARASAVMTRFILFPSASTFPSSSC